jgi:hypothetical protein
MGTSASVVSKLEAGGDVKMSTFQRYCAAIGTLDLRLLTDSAIESPRGRYTPESVLQLERRLANDLISARLLRH